MCAANSLFGEFHVQGYRILEAGMRWAFVTSNSQIESALVYFAAAKPNLCHPCESFVLEMMGARRWLRKVD